MVKILFIIESFGPGGKERRLSQIIQGLLEKGGYEIEVIVTAEIFHYKTVLENNIRVHRIDKGLGIGKHSGIIQFYKICRNFKPDIIHTWGGLITILAIPSSILCKVPLIDGQVTATTKVPIWEYIFFYRIPFIFSKKVVTNTKAAFEVYKIPKKKRHCIYNGFDLERLKAIADKGVIKKELNIETEYVIGMIASFVPLKDYETYIKAAILVLEKRQDVTFICIGKGDSTKYRQIIPENLKRYFIFSGARHDIENIINICDIGVLSSFREGLPNAVLEFMAFGKPVIATSVGGVPELINHKKDGFIFPVGNKEKLSEIIIKLLNNKNIREEIGGKASDKVFHDFSNAKMIDLYTQLYDNIKKKS